MKAYEKVKLAAEKDPSILTEKGQEESTFGHNPQYLLDYYGITKSDLIRLERAGMAMKARYVTKNKTGKAYFKNGNEEALPVDGPHRTRWLLFNKETKV